MGDTATEGDLVKLSFGARRARRQRLSRARLAQLLGEKLEAEEDVGDEDEDTSADDGEREFARALIGSRLLRRKRTKRMLLAHLLREGGEAEAGEDEDEIDDEPAEGGDEQRLVRALIGSKLLRRKRAKRMLLAYLARERGEAEGEDDEGDEEFAEGESGDDQRLVRALIGSRLLRRKRTKRMLLAHLLREKGEAEDDEEYEGAEETAGRGDDQEIVRLIVGSRILRKRRVKRALFAHLLREREEAA